MTRLRDNLLQATVIAPTLLTTEDIADIAHVSPSTVSRWSREGRFPKPLVSGGIKVRRWLTTDYLDWIASKQAERDGPSAADPPRRKRR